MSSNQPKWTSEQLKAIKTSGRDVYVTASAGTGKTAVLSARCIELLNNPDGQADITEFLVLTFTEAAAEEMSERIGQLLRKVYRQNRDARLRQQLLLLDSAQISTIHSFCQSLTREHFYLLGIDPVFGIISDDEQKLLKIRVLKETVEEAFGDNSLSQGLNTLLYGRDVTAGTMGFLDEIRDIHEFLDSTTNRDEWYEAANKFASDGLAGEIGQRQKDIVLDKLLICRQQLELMLKLDDELTNGNWNDQLRTEMIPAVRELIENVSTQSKDWQQAIICFKKPKFKNKPKGFDEETVKAVKAPAEKAFETIKNLRSFAIINPRYADIVSGSASGQTKVLIELVKRFERKYRQAKDLINRLDFADLEHYTLKLLTENKDVADKLQQRFKYVFVDEFQDINPLQEKIINMICRGDNLFVVGDVKQSIYSFRHSDPSIFIDRISKANTEIIGSEPVRIDLSVNFRSRKGVLDFANTIFERIMLKDVGGIDYDQKAKLTAGFEYEDAGGPSVWVDVIDETVQDSNEENQAEEKASDNFDYEPGVISAAQRQASLIVKRIQQIINDKVNVYDKSSGQYRPVTYGDIVVLMRSLTVSAKEYVELFGKAGIPVSSQSQAGYFEATEITDMLSLLKVLDNPKRDIELAGIMRSPLFKISDTELALIRGHGDKIDKVMDFYQCAAEYSQAGRDQQLKAKVANMLSTLDEWRSIGRRGEIADLIWKVYRQTGYLAFVRGTVSGKQRYANLLKLHDRAIQFEGFADAKSASLARFVEFIEELLENENDWAPAQPDAGSDNAVRIMSVHKSKGLEYPVVFLAETNRGFNMRDARGQCLTDKTGVLGLKVIDPETKYGFKTLQQQVIAEEKSKQTIAEEMRILYVAMTRARERLYITTTKKQSECANILQQCDGNDLMDFQISSAKCHFDWVLYGLGGFQELRGLFDDNGASLSNELFSARIYDKDELDKLANDILFNTKSKLSSKTEAAISTEDIYRKVLEAWNWQYPHTEDTLKQAKTSVSELTHRDDEFAEYDLSTAFEKMPEILSENKTSDTIATGNATHLLINQCIIKKVYEADKINALLKRLVNEGLISEQIATKVNTGGINNFFASELGKMLHQNTVHSEWPFTIDEDNVIIQGIIDCIIETDNGLIVIDFKTGKNFENKLNKYKKQVEYYSKAAKKTLNKKVISKHLYFVDVGETITIE